MTNHLYALLMNLDGTLPPDTATPGMELIDPSYRAVDYPGFIVTIRNVLFGPTPDRDMLAYRCRQLLSVVHATALDGFVSAMDPRLTYRLSDNDLADDAGFIPVVTKLAGGSDARLDVIGNPEAPDTAGQVRIVFMLTTLTSTTVQVARQTTPISKPVLDFTVDTPVKLTGSGYYAKIRTNEVGQSWLIETRNRPQRSLDDLLQSVSKVGEPVLDAVFGVTKLEPFQTFRNIWNHNTDAPLRLAALVVALGLRSEEARLHL